MQQLRSDYSKDKTRKHGRNAFSSISHRSKHKSTFSLLRLFKEIRAEVSGNRGHRENAESNNKTWAYPQQPNLMIAGGQTRKA
jgi:hypothetical protein